MLKEIDCYFFSGTGNTIQVLQEIKRVLNEHSINLHFHAIEKASASSIREEASLFLALPINSQSTLPFIWKFIRSLPKANNKQVFVVCTQNESSGINKPLYHMLRKKGYNPVGYSEIKMPNNTSMTSFNDVEYITQVENGIEKAREFALSIVQGTSKWEPVNSGSSFVSLLTRNTPLPWMTMRLMFPLGVNEPQCSQCGTCLKSCPVHNIKTDTYPKHGSHCEFCMRCISNCPSKAIYVKGKPKFKVRQSNNNHKDVDEILN